MYELNDANDVKRIKNWNVWRPMFKAFPLKSPIYSKIRIESP